MSVKCDHSNQTNLSTEHITYEEREREKERERERERKRERERERERGGEVTD